MRILDLVEIVNITSKARRLSDVGLVGTHGQQSIEVGPGETTTVTMTVWHRHCHEPWWQRKEKYEALQATRQVMETAPPEPEALPEEIPPPAPSEPLFQKRRRPGRPRKEIKHDE